MIKDRVKSAILNNGLIRQGEHIVIGLSGGPDSVCLFHLLHRMKDELDITLHAVHINHGLRPGAAEEDQRYVEDLCAEYGVDCRCFSFDVTRIAREKGISGEDAGRQVRYQSFFEVGEWVEKETGRTVKVAVAQNRNDQAETVLMRILRGTGTDGLAGIEPMRREEGRGVVIRPLLDVSREEIEAYCLEHGLNPRIDLTNLEPVYTRNKIRLELIPYLMERFNPNLVMALTRLSKIAGDDKDYFGQRVEGLMAEHAILKGPDRVAFPLEHLSGAHPAIRRRLILRLLEGAGLCRDVTGAQLLQAERLLLAEKTSGLADFNAGYVMEISYGTAEFYKKREKESLSFAYEINLEGATDIPELNAEIRVKILRRQNEDGPWKKGGRADQPGFDRLFEGGRAGQAGLGKPSGSGRTCRLSFDKLSEAGCKPVLRTRRPGDYLVPLGMGGRKKLQDFFVDEKVPREERDRIPLLCLGSEAIWVVGGRISENFKVDDATERIIVLEYLIKM